MWRSGSRIMLRRSVKCLPTFRCHRRTLANNAAESADDTTNKTTTIRLYRILMRLCNDLNDDCPLQQSLDPHENGVAQHYSPSDTTTSSIYQLFANWDHKNLDVNDWIKSISHGTNSDPVSIFVSRQEVKDAIRDGFVASTGLMSIDQLHRLAIDAIRFLNEQVAMQKRTSVSLDTERGLRIVATSSWVGRSSSGSLSNELMYRFAYRIRVENMSLSSQCVQVLGRTWLIQDLDEVNGEPVGEPQGVHQPMGGLVGHQPVLHPGNVFEYMSSCGLLTRHGTMSGSFHIANVPPETTSAKVGDPILVDMKDIFEMPIEPFPLVADNTNRA